MRKHRRAALARTVLAVAVVASAAAPVRPGGAATETDPHVVLDLRSGRLRLMSGGAVLRDYPVRSAEVGRPTVLFVGRDPRVPPDGEVRTLQSLHPPRPDQRPVVVAPEPGTEPEPAAPPPSPEEACPAPDVYVLRFEDGLAIEVRSDGPRRDPWWRAAGHRLGSFARALAPRPEIRIRLTMPAADAGDLYRSLPTPSGWIVRRGSP